MRAVALRMAGGDFHARANDQERGEMGDLARALNHLSAELGNTIADLRRERNQAVAIVNALHEGVMAVSASGRPTQTNPAMQALTRQAGGGKALPLPDEIWGDVRTALAENRPTDRRLDFGAIRLHVTVNPIADGRGVASAIAVLRDETEAYRLEQTRREYVANVSHELRTPLTALRAMIEPLRDGLIRTEAQKLETYDIILRETMRLSRLVDDMLELSRLQSGTLALEKVRFPLAPLLQETAAIYAAKAAGTGHSLSLELGEAPLPDVLGNPDRIEQVLVALLNNAFTYTPPGSHIALRTEAEAAALRVIVEDNGPGIAPGDLPLVFDSFYTADKSPGGGGGTGLGLAIARELMERLGETIGVENCEGGGARFWFTVGVGTSN
jgi:two-component system sensor histidine kinase ResE